MGDARSARGLQAARKMDSHKENTSMTSAAPFLFSRTPLASPRLASLPALAASEGLPAGFKETTQSVGNDMTLHYVRGGTGEPVVLIHGFAETARMWRPLLGVLGKSYTVLTPDLPGLGGSSPEPSGVYDMKTVAQQIHELVKRLGFTRIRLVGHDIGLMAAYAYAAQYPEEVQKLVLMDAPIPGVGDTWEKVYTNPALWHFHFAFSPIALRLVQGRERIFLDHFWISFSGDPQAVAISESERAAYTAAYAQQGAMQAGLGYFKGFPQDAEDNKEFLKAGKLSMPVLVLEGERSMGGALTAQANEIAGNVQSVILKGAGHWIMEERLQEVQSAIVAFLRD
jgi:pimeloyl-ACP methyl ester carboxylesterase